MRKNGFTLVEVLVALTILTTALVPVFVLASNAVSLSTRIKNSLIGAALAQEGVELVRAMRDDNWFAGRPFDFGLGGCASGCRVQWDADAPLALGANPSLQVTADGKYQYGGGADSIFRRKVTVETVGDARRVTSEVTWMERSVSKKFAVEYYLYDWLE